MFNRGKQAKRETIEELLKSVEAFNGNDDVKSALRRFIEHNLLMANGVIIIWTHGKHVDIDGTNFSEPEAVWALEKAKHQLLDKGLSFND